ncbi:MAG: hypothetical protein RL213_1914 [Bacteroidota bacterium]|jgi:tetratricopeptide (TPR) repeat protein
MRLLLPFLLCLSAVTSASASYRLTSDVSKAQELVFKLRFAEAAPFLAKAAQEDPSNLLVASVRCKQYFLTAFLSEEESALKAFLDEAEALDDRIESSKPAADERYAAFVQGELSVFRVLLHTRNRDFIAAAWDLNSCHSLITRNKKKFPGFLPNEMVHGAVTAALGAIPSEYEWLLRMVGLDGDIESGKNEITHFLRNASGTPYACFMDEAAYTLASLHYSLTPELPADSFLLEQLELRSPENDLLKYAYTGLLQKNRQNDHALEIIGTSSAAEEGVYPMAFMHLRRGHLLLCRMDTACEKELRLFVGGFKGTSFIKSAWQKIAWNRLLQGDMIGYRSAMNVCKKYGAALFDEDKDAQREAEDGIPPNRYLLRSRLLFDGGYTSEALKAITGIPSDSFPSVRDKLELTYRYARILHVTGRTEQAMVYYEKTLKNGENSSYYFSANSALMMGEICERRNDLVKAREYYHRCLSMRDHDYQNGIDQKAKAGLKRVDSR